ncbi:MAG: nitroreductase family protein [Endomicrobiaceae bacterium]|jgi:nitroreductase|nr:nitroreductase family protein [Endomicrobiaceae bacterium]
MDILFDRKSCRNYKSDDIPQDDLDYILHAGMSSPSAYNTRHWSFIVIKNKEIHKKIMQIHSASQMLANAPLAIVVCADLEKQYKNYWQQDCAASTENILLAATAKGYGSVWCGVAPIEDRVKGFRELLNIPENIMPFSLIVIGRSAEDKPAKQRWEPSKIKYEIWR